MNNPQLTAVMAVLIAVAALCAPPRAAVAAPDTDRAMLRAVERIAVAVERMARDGGRCR